MAGGPAALAAALVPALAVAGCAGGPVVGGGSPEVAFEAMDVPAFAAPGSLTEAWADVDGDGDPDRFVGFNGAPGRLYRNDGAGRFEDVAPALGLDLARRVRSAAWGDPDGDGDPDLFLGFADGERATALLRNDGGAGFTDITVASGVALDSGSTRQPSWVDYDGDGDLDLFLALRDGPNRLWRNEGGLRFTDVTAATGIGDPRRSVGAVWLDHDGDGDLDAYVANMDGDDNGLWRNDGGRFTDVARAAGLAGGGRPVGDPSLGSVRPCAADVDGDGDLDLSTANYGTNGVFLNPGDGGPWTPAAPELAGDGSGRFDACAWADFDHDGRLDLFVNGTITGGVQHPDHLWRATPTGFVEVTPPALRAVAADHGVTWVDVDGDGDLDLSLTGVSDAGSHPILRNGLSGSARARALSVRVLDARGRSGVPGAEVRAYAAGTDRLLATGLVDTGSGYDAQNDLPVHLGLREPGPVDLEVIVPRAGRRLRNRVEGVDPGALRGRPVVVRVAPGT